MLCSSIGKYGNILISMETMGQHQFLESMLQHFLMISDSMGKHMQAAWELLIFMISNSMEKHGKHGTAFLMISNSMGSMGTPFYHEFRWDKKSIGSMGSMCSCLRMTYNCIKHYIKIKICTTMHY